MLPRASNTHVTVILPVYNASGTLDRAIRSVLRQTHTDLDLVLIDDGSTDASHSICVRYASAEPRVTLIRFAGNRGLAAALNAGWRAARGPLVARMDADDECAEERIQRQVAFLAANPDVAVVGTAARFMSKTGRVLGIVKRRPEHEAISARILTEIAFIHPSVVMRKGFCEALGGYDERLTAGAEDFDLWLRGCERFRYANLPSPLLTYTMSAQKFRASMARAGIILRYSLGRGRWRSALWPAMRPLLGWIAARLHVPTPNRSGWRRP